METTLREKLFGKATPLREKLATLSTGALSVVSGRTPFYMAAKGATDVTTDEQKKKEEQDKIDADVRQKETLGQIDMNARQGYHSDKKGNVTTPIEGFNKEAGTKASPIDFSNQSEFERTMAELPGAMRDTVLAWADKIKNGNKMEYVAPKKEEMIASIANADEVKKEDTPRFNKDVFTKGIAHNESRGAKNPYTAVGPTKDLGKYQASPDTLKSWSKAWLGKEYTPQEFLKNPEAQEKFFEEFTRVAERLNLTHEQAAVAWHRGWGELGIGDKKTRDKRFLDKLNAMMGEEISQRYLDSFAQGTPSQN